MPRKLICQLGPAAYRLSVLRCVTQRNIGDAFSGIRFAREKAPPLPVKIYVHASLIRRRLHNVDMRLQENKAVNLALAAPRLNGILIHPGETFSFWRLVGACTARKGYLEGMYISSGRPTSGVGGGMCQMSNLIHWMALHSELEIVEHHHHDQVDLFPDFGRQIPFGTGTSIAYNYLDYRLFNPTEHIYQLRIWVDGEYLRGELRANVEQEVSFHIRSENEHFELEDDAIYRCGIVYRETVDRRTGVLLARKVIRENHARVLYDLNITNAGV